MAVSAFFVIVMCNILIAALRKLPSDEVRIPIFIVIIASFVTIVDLVMKAYLPSVYSFLGVWIPLIVVNCIVLGRAEAFAYRNTVWLSAGGGRGAGGVYAGSVVGRAGLRGWVGGGRVQFLGATLISVPAFYSRPNVLLLFPGAFSLFWLIIAGSQAMNRRIAGRHAAQVASVKEAM